MEKYITIGFCGYIVCLLLSALFHGYKAGIKSLSESVLKEREEANDRMVAYIKNHVENDKKFSRVVSVVDACVYIFMGLCASWSFSNVKLLMPAFSGQESFVPEKIVLVVIIVLLILIIEAVGRVIPTKLGAHNPEKWCFGMAGRIKVLSIPFYPLSWIIGGIAWLGLKFVGIDLHADANVTEEAIISIVNEGHEQGVLKASEAEMISNIFGFAETYAKEIMTHRTNIVSLDGTITLEQAMEVMLNGSFSRYPVYMEDADDVVGILYFRDVVAASQMPRYKKMAITEIPGLLRETMFIPETKTVNLLFQEMQKQKIHMATVIDEYGQIAGIVTMEDIIEEIVGNIQDEYDEEEEVIEEKEDGSFLIDGLVSMAEVVNMIGSEFEELEYETLNGFLIATLDRIPQEGETPEIIWKNYKFQVLEVEGKIIRQVRVTKEEVQEEKVVEEKENGKK